MTAVWKVPTMPALLIFSIVLALCSHLVQGTTTMGASTAGDVTTTYAGTTKVGSTGTTQRMVMSSQDSTPSVTTTVAMTSTAQNTSMEATTQAADDTTVGTTTTMAADATTGSAGSTPDGTTTTSHMTVNTESTVKGTTSGTTGMADGMTNITTTGTPGTATNSTSQTAMLSTTGKMNTMITTTGTTDNINTTTPMAGTMDNMNTTTPMAGTMDNMDTTTSMSGTMGNMDTTTAMSGTMGNINTTMTGTTDTKNTTAETPGTTAGAMSTTNQTMDVTEVTTSIQTTGTPDADMNTTTPEPSGTTTSLTTGTTELEVTGTMTSDTGTMNTTMISTTQANTTSMTTAATTMEPGPYSWNVTFDANCTVAMDNEEEFLQNCSIACADWLGIHTNFTRCRNITCGSTNVVVEVDRAADTNNDISQKFHSLNDANPPDPLTFSFGGTDFRATAADVIVAPPLPTTTVESTTIQPTTRPVPFCMIDGFEDDTACVVFLCSVIAIGLILLIVILWGIIKCCRRQNRKSFDLISDIPHISLSDYPMTTIPRPSVYQHQNDYGQVNMAYITEDEVDKGKPPLESSASSSQSSHSPGRVEDEKTTSALPLLQTDDSRNHVQPEIASPPVMSYQPRDAEEQPPPVYSPQSGTNSVVQPTGTDQAPGPYPSPTTSPVTEAKSDVPETTDDADYEVPDEGVTISFREAPTQDTPESPKVIKGEDGSVSVVVNW